MAGLGFAIMAGAAKGVGEGMVADAKAKREEALKRLDMERQDSLLDRQENFQREMQEDRQAFALEKAQATPEKPTELMRNYREAVKQGFEGTILEYQTAVKKAGATKVTTNVGGNKFEEGLAKFQAGMIGDLYQDGLKAKKDLAMIGQLEGLSRQFESGGGAKIKQFAGEFGIDSANLSEIQSFQAVINKMVPEQRPAGSGPMSDADLELFKQSLPRIINQPGGNALIMKALRGIAEYRVEQGKISERLMTGEIDRKQAIKDLSSLSNPLEEFNKALGGAGKDRASAIKKKYGLE